MASLTAPAPLLAVGGAGDLLELAAYGGRRSHYSCFYL
jgi:hypothetical protein